MMKQAFTKLGVFTLLSLLCPAFLYAQVVTDERMFSFEDPQVPECISATRSQLSISDTHYKDGKHSMEWACPSRCNCTKISRMGLLIHVFARAGVAAAQASITPSKS